MTTGTELAEAVLEEINDEIQEHKEAVQKLEVQAQEAHKEKDEAWEKYLGDGPDSPIDPEAQRQYERAFKTEHNISSAITKHRKQMEKLHSPDEFDQRMEQKLQKGGRKMTDQATKTPKETARDQGVPETYLNKETGTFRIGMDARLKSDLVNAVLGIESEDALHSFTAAEAEKLINRRGWESFLERKREIVAEKAKRAEEREKAREEAARERAEAKAQKDAEKQAAKASKSDGESNSKSSGKATSKSDQARAQREAKAAASS